MKVEKTLRLIASRLAAAAPKWPAPLAAMQQLLLLLYLAFAALLSSVSLAQAANPPADQSVITDEGDFGNAGGLIILKNDASINTSAVTATPTHQVSGREKLDFGPLRPTRLADPASVPSPAGKLQTIPPSFRC